VICKQKYVYVCKCLATNVKVWEDTCEIESGDKRHFQMLMVDVLGLCSYYDLEMFFLFVGFWPSLKLVI
jgi:hypothetical protein